MPTCSQAGFQLRATGHTEGSRRAPWALRPAASPGLALSGVVCDVVAGVGAVHTHQLLGSPVCASVLSAGVLMTIQRWRSRAADLGHITSQLAGALPLDPEPDLVQTLARTLAQAADTATQECCPTRVAQTRSNTLLLAFWSLGRGVHAYNACQACPHFEVSALVRADLFPWHPELSFDAADLRSEHKTLPRCGEAQGHNRAYRPVHCSAQGALFADIPSQLNHPVLMGDVRLPCATGVRRTVAVQQAARLVYAGPRP